MSAQPQQPRESEYVHQTEKTFTENVMECARLNGWLCAHFHDSRRQVRPGVFVGDSDAKGFPDCVFVRGPRLVFAELKVGKNKATPAQKEWLAALERVEGPVQVRLWTPTDWPEIERVLSRRAA